MRKGKRGKTVEISIIPQHGMFWYRTRLGTMRGYATYEAARAACICEMAGSKVRNGR